MILHPLMCSVMFTVKQELLFQYNKQNELGPGRAQDSLQANLIVAHLAWTQTTLQKSVRGQTGEGGGSCKNIFDIFQGDKHYTITAVRSSGAEIRPRKEKQSDLLTA